MAAYNAEKTIGVAVDSVLCQTYNDYELIIVNDCSSDNTAAIITKFAQIDNRIKIINNDVNKGVSFSRYAGLKEASGEWIAILDSDDAWKPDKLEKQLLIQTATDADIIYTGSAFMNSEGSPIEWILNVPSEVSYKRLLKQNIISNSSAMVRKSLYCDYYASGDNMHEDFATWLGILKAGYKAVGVNEPLLIYRLTKSSKSGNKVKSAKMNLNTYKYIGLNPIESAYYMCWYIFNGIKKYKNF